MRGKSWVWMDCQVTPRSLQKCQREYYNQITITRWKAASWRKKKIYEKLLLFFFKQKCLNNARVLVRRDLITEILKWKG